MAGGFIYGTEEPRNRQHEHFTHNMNGVGVPNAHFHPNHLHQQHRQDLYEHLALSCDSCGLEGGQQGAHLESCQNALRPGCNLDIHLCCPDPDHCPQICQSIEGQGRGRSVSTPCREHAHSHHYFDCYTRPSDHPDFHVDDYICHHVHCGQVPVQEAASILAGLGSAVVSPRCSPPCENDSCDESTQVPCAYDGPCTRQECAQDVCHDDDCNDPDVLVCDYVCPDTVPSLGGSACTEQPRLCPDLRTVLTAYPCPNPERCSSKGRVQDLKAQCCPNEHLYSTDNGKNAESLSPSSQTNSASSPVSPTSESSISESSISTLTGKPAQSSFSAMSGVSQLVLKLEPQPQSQWQSLHTAPRLAPRPPNTRAGSSKKHSIEGESFNCEWRNPDRTICNNLFSNDTDFSNHVGSVHIQPLFAIVTPDDRRGIPCEMDQCHSCFDSLPHLLAHIVYKHGSAQGKSCPVCAHPLQGHNKRLKLANGKVRCCGCNQELASMSTYHSHLRSRHTGERSSVCPECGYCCADPSNMTSHMRIHRGRQFECDVCQKRFVRADQCKRHRENCLKKMARRREKDASGKAGRQKRKSVDLRRDRGAGEQSCRGLNFVWCPESPP